MHSSVQVTRIKLSLKQVTALTCDGTVDCVIVNDYDGDTGRMVAVVRIQLTSPLSAVVGLKLVYHQIAAAKNTIIMECL